jgi:hypothetical protein
MTQHILSNGELVPECHLLHGRPEELEVFGVDHKVEEGPAGRLQPRLLPERKYFFRDSEKETLHRILRRSVVDVMITIFCESCQFSAKKMAFLSKTNVMFKFLHNLGSFV